MTPSGPRGLRVTVNPWAVVLLVVAALCGLVEESICWLLALTAHELGHLFVAGVLGHELGHLEVGPFGASAHGADTLMRDSPSEAMVALAGPASNLLFMGLVTAGLRWWPGNPLLWRRFIDVNLAIACLNLLPILPLDGGRIARCWLATRRGYSEASRVLSRIGRWTAVALLVVSLASALHGEFWPFGPLVAAVAWQAANRARQQAGYASIRQALWRQQRLARRRLLPERRLVASHDLPVREAIRALLPGQYCLFLVTGPAHEPLGTVSEGDVLTAYLQGRGHQPLSSLLVPPLCHR